MAIDDKIKYDFNQILIGLKGFVANLELKLHEICPDLPVFILQTGDASFYLNSKFEDFDNTNKEIYQKVPRFVIGFDDPQPMADQNTNQYNKFVYVKDDKNYMVSGRRIAIQLTSNTDFISSNYIKALENFEIISTITARQNAFSYEFMNNTFEGAYNISSNTQEKPGMDMSSGTRNFSIKTSFEVQLHLLVPRIETIQLLSETGFDTIDFNIIGKGETQDLTDRNNLTITAEEVQNNNN